MTWPFVAGVLLVLLVILWVLAENGVGRRVSGDQLYVVMWNDAVVGVTSSRAVAEEFCTKNALPDQGHYVRWLPFTLNGKFQIFQHQGNNWGRPTNQPRYKSL